MMEVKYFFLIFLIWKTHGIPVEETEYCMQAVYAIPVSASNETQVQVAQGWLSGEILQTVTEDMYYYSFKGIPYAEPPVGTLRFKAPQAPLSWDGVRNATEHGSVCPQVNIFTNVLTPGDEDCLFLNVYTPTLTPNTSLPVMVFIHGGGYASGSGDVDNYGPDFLVRKYVIVVTLNYRLDSLGFLSMGTEEVPGNAGLKDQVAALEWVQANIAAFGGNPKNVTIIGQSAGSASVAYHILSPRSKGLFQRAISMSGVPFCDFSLEFHPERRAHILGLLLANYTITNDTELLDFLQGVDADKLVGTLPAVLASEPILNNFVKLFSFVPVVETNGSYSFLSEDPSAILSEGTINEVDVMFGYTSAEVLTATTQIEDYLMERYTRYAEMVVPTKVLFSSTPVETVLEISDKVIEYYFGDKNISLSNMREFVNYMNNASFVYDIQRFYAKFPKLENNKMFFYKFSSVSSRNVYGSLGAKYGITGAGHLDDLMYLFDAKSLNITLDMNSTEYALIEQATTVFTNFAKYGNPTPDDSLGVTWPEYNNETLCYVDIGSNLTAACAPDEADMTFWKSIFEYANLSF